MAKIAFILHCHQDPEAIIQQAEQISAAGDYVSIHYDGRASNSDFARLKQSLADNANVVFARKRIKCGWGEWSLVQANIETLVAAESQFEDAIHFYMISGDCQAIKSAEYARDFLENNDYDFIESFDYFESDWIKTGFKEERLIYRHFLNERKHKALFYQMLNF